MKNKFTSKNGVFNVVCNTDDRKDSLGYYCKETREIMICVKNTHEYFKEEKNILKLFKEEIFKTTIHELTHFFDYNGWNSWLYKEDHQTEQLAVFNDLYLIHIYDLATQILKWILELIDDKKIILGQKDKEEKE